MNMIYIFTLMLATVASAQTQKVDCLTSKDQKNHSRMMMELSGGKLSEFAFYWVNKPRTCTIPKASGENPEGINRKNSKWIDSGNESKINLGNGDITIYKTNDGYKFIFSNIDKAHYCGMEDKLNAIMEIKNLNNPTCTYQEITDQTAPQGNSRSSER